MSIERCLRALAFFSISAVIALSASGDVPPEKVRAAELEAGLASNREVYLVLGVESHDLAVRVRGLTLESVPVQSVVAYEQRRLTESRDGGPLEIPRVFVTAATISLVDRRVVAPRELKPWSDEAETGNALTKAEDRPVPPSSYDVPLEDGWVLEVRQDPVDLTRTGRLLAAIANGWSHLAGSRVRDSRPSLRLVTDEASAMRIHHLFKKGAAILVVPDTGYRPGR